MLFVLVKIAAVWWEHYCNLDNWVKMKADENADGGQLSYVYDAIMMLDNKKACGMEHITAKILHIAS